ncbi:MAG: hypothetical protein NTX30_20530 [Deltaproteobacteria bacterium]|nr:hypothetical protein [Deltaproteobacteria bacterium]
MADDDFDYETEYEEERPPDPIESEAKTVIKSFFEMHMKEVFFSRQVEVIHEDQFFHWITNRAIRDLVAEGVILGEKRKLRNGGPISLLWHRSYRFYKRSADKVIALVEKYSDPEIGESIGLHGETMVLEAFARSEFLMKGRNIREYRGEVWRGTEQNLDFIFERDSIGYGVEVKNKLGYMDLKEFSEKTEISRFLGLCPVFIARMLPKTWIHELNMKGGFALILKYQLYPWTHRNLAKRVAEELSLPVDAPRAIAEATMERFLRWHFKRI